MYSQITKSDDFLTNYKLLSVLTDIYANAVDFA